MAYGQKPKCLYNRKSAAKPLSYYDMGKVQRPAVRRTLQANGNGNGVDLIY